MKIMPIKAFAGEAHYPARLRQKQHNDDGENDGDQVTAPVQRLVYNDNDEDHDDGDEDDDGDDDDDDDEDDDDVRCGRR